MKVIKRDGRVVNFDYSKLQRVVLWACDNKEAIANNLIKEVELRLTDVIRIQDMYDELIKITVNSISAITPIYDDIAKKLLLLI